MAQDRGCDADLIDFIIEANTLLIRTQNRNFHAYIVTHQNAHIRKLQHDIASLCYQRDKLVYHLRVGVTNPILTQNEEFFLQHLGLPIPFAGNTITINTYMGPVDSENLKQAVQEFFSMIDTVDSMLTEREREAIMKKYVGSSTKKFTASNMSLLRFLHEELVVQKAREFKLSHANPYEPLLEVLTYVHRQDLVAKFQSEIVTIFSTERFQSSGPKEPYPTDSRKGNQPVSSPPTTKQTKRKQKETKKEKRSTEDVNERLERIEDMLKNLTSAKKETFEEFNDVAPYGTKYSFPNPSFCGTPQYTYDWSKLSKSKFFSET